MTSDPFKVYTPESLTAEEMNELFVPLAQELSIDGTEHVFMHGPRGCGKSMLLRLLNPDCQILRQAKPLASLPFLAIYSTVKEVGLDVTEYERIRNQFAGTVLAEHALTSFLGARVFATLRELSIGPNPHISPDTLAETKGFLARQVLNRLRSGRVDITASAEDIKTATEVRTALDTVATLLGSAHSEVNNYLRLNSFTSEYVPYSGPLLSYADFLFPVLCQLRDLSFLPKGPLFVVIDDADNLNELQTRVLNSWVGARSGSKVVFKLSTQLRYKTYLTSADQRIEAPHDFREIYLSSIYTGAAGPDAYFSWVREVVNKRLKNAVRADEFFPSDEKQEVAIKAIGDELRAGWASSGKGYRPGDDAYRYARPDYIKSLGGESKQQSTYRYAGFSQLVHISSGLVRFFLDSASAMHDRQRVRVAPNAVAQIDPDIQDAEVRAAADKMMFVDLDRLEDEARKKLSAGDVDDLRLLRNLIRTLGAVFYEILVSERSERRVFSIALSDDPSPVSLKILKLGVEHGYLFEASVGSKEGRWRTRRFILSRRLAPHFKLDPTGFSGYLFVTDAFILGAMSAPKRAVERFKQDRLTVPDDGQLTLDL